MHGFRWFDVQYLRIDHVRRCNASGKLFRSAVAHKSQSKVSFYAHKSDQ